MNGYTHEKADVFIWEGKMTATVVAYVKVAQTPVNKKVE
jgi:hypothetical protein